MIRHRIHEPEVFVRKPQTERGARLKAFQLLIKDKATTKISLGVIVLTSVQNFWLLRHHHLDARLPVQAAGVQPDQIIHVDRCDRAGHDGGHLDFPGHLADRIGRKPSFLLFQLGAVVMVLVYSQLSDPTTMLWAGAVLGKLFVNGMLGGLGAVMSEAYPTGARAMAQNVLFNIGRGGGRVRARWWWVRWPWATGFQMAIALLAAIYVLDMIATVFLIPELKGKELH